MRIALRNISKHFGTIRANDGVNLTVEPGTVHGVLGENGAGKSTLMKILAGYSQKTSGKIRIDGAPAEYATPSEAAGLGIGMLYQDPLDFPFLTVLDNFILGQKTGLVGGRQEFGKKLDRLAGNLNFPLNPNALVNSLTIGERQQLEILRLFALGTKTLILDEPTTGISSLQKEILFGAVKKMTEEGKSVILVSHKLEDVITLCDSVTVLRKGKAVGKADRPFDTDGLLKIMFDALPAPPPKPAGHPGEAALVMEGVSATGGRTGLRSCDAVIRKGEVVGLAGLEGSGQGVFLRVSAGLKSPSGGALRLFDRKVNGKDHHFFKTLNVNFLPGSRLEEGLVPDLTIAEHYAIRDRRGMFVNRKAAIRTAEENIARFTIKGTPESPAESLSGGNQQRLLLSFLPQDPALLLLENPTRGLDLESANWVWRYLLDYCKGDTSIVFSSSELDEILSVSDRILVFFEGEIVRDVRTGETDAQELGRAIAGK